MKRRALLAALVLPARAQAAVPTVGYLTLNGRADTTAWRAFADGLGDRGFVEGRSVAAELRSAEGRPERLNGLAMSLVERHVDAIFASSGTAEAPLAAKAATATIPVVFLVTGDPVRDGLAESLAVPNGNLTGVALLQDQTTLKQAEMLSALLPGPMPLAILMDAGATGLQVAASGAVLQAKLGRKVLFVRPASEAGFDAMLTRLASQGMAGLVIAGGALYTRHHQLLAALAARHGLPTVYPDVDADLAQSGGLMSYGPSLSEMFRSAGSMLGRVLKGAPPRHMAVERPTRLVLKINVRAARLLGLTVPQRLLARADEVIE